MMKTALYRTEDGNLHIMRDDFFRTNEEMRQNLKGNGFRVLKVWNGNKTDREIEEWEFLNRK